MKILSKLTKRYLSSKNDLILNFWWVTDYTNSE
jgi:hypothetical protein